MVEIEYVAKTELVNDPNARVGKGHSILSVPCVSLAGPDPLTSVMKPYDEFKKPVGEGYFRLSSWENGGAQLSAGEAEVVCGLHGEKLMPKFIRRKADVEEDDKGNITKVIRPLACSLHAIFVGEGLVIVKSSHYRKTFSVEISEYVITNQTDGSVRAKTLWKVNLGLVMNPDDWVKTELPAPYSEFGDAIKAAMEKAQHLHCREPHYYIEPPDRSVE